ARGEHVLGLAVEAEREDRRVFEKPDLVGRFVAAFLREGLHAPPRRFVVDTPEVAQYREVGHAWGRRAHRQKSTRSLSVSSRYSASSCSWLSARKVTVTERKVPDDEGRALTCAGSMRPRWRAKTATTSASKSSASRPMTLIGNSQGNSSSLPSPCFIVPPVSSCPGMPCTFRARAARACHRQPAARPAALPATHPGW